MTSKCRQELLDITRSEYLKATREEKQTILDGFTSATGYNRKYAIGLLNGQPLRVVSRRQRKAVYGTDVKSALVVIWSACNRIASKRLAPLIPIMIEKLETFGHLKLEPEIKAKVLALSAATIDRLLRDERKKFGRSKGTTRPGNLLKKQVAIRTFAEWDNAVPGFVEADLVAHCGGIAKGLFLHTLTVTDICTGWTEMWPVIAKTDDAVLGAFKEVSKFLPFPLQGIDTDNGSEFINYLLAGWCENQNLTFTRSREYRKNDQAHVEEKNGSIIRRFVGYDRYDSAKSFANLRDLYRVLRLYVNFFQPSMKLVHKERDGAKVRKQYDVARTPYHRLLESGLGEHERMQLQRRFDKLDPVQLIAQIERLQLKLWGQAAQPMPATVAADSFAFVLGKVVGQAPSEAVLVRAKHYRATLKNRVPVRITEPVLSAQVDYGVGQTACMRQYISECPTSQLITISDLTKMGSRGCINQLLKHLVQHGKLVKVDKATYAKPGYRAGESALAPTGNEVEDMLKFILSLEPERTFRCRNLLQYGSSAAAYNLVKKLLRQGKIVKIRRNTYQRAE